MVRRTDFDSGLNQLRELLIRMGNRMDEALKEAVESLKNDDLAQAEGVIRRDGELNALEEEILELGSQLIITQQPVAKDLRRIIVAFKISSDLERMGDLARDIAKVTIRLDGQHTVKPLVDIPRMAEISSSMISESLRSYMDENTDLAYKMAKDDDEVDELYGSMLRELYTLLIDNPESAPQMMLIQMVGRYIERIADHATNIGENVVFLVTGHRPDLNS
ncbi:MULTISPECIES: phosphate signaling complex protein PhoU [Saccharibacillus]|uniref:Phosphate-specific transport system accessory protein PhoU n=1 Tax=Saccharibacillus brassicae TaxID=2583377 RepID=A0A4Y6UXV5_SACBS|nr:MULTISPECIES: phosphate signaling complex protein PhoU [Saccharibacillus]MWJ33584.1 phosphate signaling complex protein PhoU [Saccharibacillus sp. WB 17]QDH22579.1 phosphate signaling complex protein PhoU [Saccharibacillus brassicae]